MVSDAGYQIAFSPPFSVDFSQGPDHGQPGEKGVDGREWGQRASARCRTNLHRLPPSGGTQSQPYHGAPGLHGTHGRNGHNGRNGGMCKLAEITIRRVTGQVSIFCQAGNGGNGGKGGHGGQGGQGGQGADGFKTLAGPIPGGNGGNGGKGGDGSRGGHAGNGGIASNIYVEVQEADLPKVSCLSLPSQPGNPGPGGKGGAGGIGGASGKGTIQHTMEPKGHPGRSGAHGSPGNTGRTRPAPYIFLNGEIVSGKKDPTNITQPTTPPNKSMNRNFEQRMSDLGIDQSVFDTATEVLVTKTILDVEELKAFLDAGIV